MKYSGVFLGLGSNIGNRSEYLDAAITMLQEDKNINVLQLSSVIETEPIGDIAVGLFLNQVIEIETEYDPRELLECCIDIEQVQGRVRDKKWDSRTLDIDILFYGNHVLEESGLNIPHPEIPNRMFVLAPMVEIAPEFKHPVGKKSMRQLCSLLS
jgi:2-amino-4-hydroxy-6-hydroxymethyldihydropteridine diphosphokinase